MRDLSLRLAALMLLGGVTALIGFAAILRAADPQTYGSIVRFFSGIVDAVLGGLSKLG